MKRRIVQVVGAIAAVALVLTGCNADVPDQTTGGSDEKSGDLTKVSIATQPWIGYGPWQIAVDQGLDEAFGIELDLLTFNTDADMISAFGSGRVPLADAAVNTSAVYINGGQDLRTVLIQAVSTTADGIIAGPDIRGPEDLRGKRVAFEEGATSDILLRHYLMQADMTLEDITVVGTPASSAGAALLSGGVDAAVTYEPYLSGTIAEDDALSLIHSSGEEYGLVSDALVVNPDWAEDNAETLEAVLLVWDAAVQFYNDNPEEGQRIIAEAIDADPEELASTFEGVHLVTLEESNDIFASGEYDRLTTLLAELWGSSGDDELAAVDLTSVAAPSFGESALQR